MECGQTFPSAWFFLQAEKSYKPFRSYAQSKLANVMTAAEMHHRHNQVNSFGTCASLPRVTAVSVHPGLVDTELARNYFETDFIPSFLRPVARPLLRPLFPYLLLPAVIGCRSLVWAAFAPSDEVGGRFVSNCAVQPPAAAANDATKRKLLWDVSCQLTNSPIMCS